MSTSKLLLPWLQGDWQRLLRYVQEQRIPQALLITGLENSGEEVLASLFAQALLCDKPAGNGESCGCCSACQLFQADNHPDFLVIEPKEAGAAIVVDTVRELAAKLALAPQYTRHRVVVFHHAQQLNTAAANSLLKTLEEPSQRTVILLLTGQPGRLPATILSRCQRFTLNQPDVGISVNWMYEKGSDREKAEACLALANGAPLKALVLAETDILEQQKNLYHSWLQLAQGVSDPVLTAEIWLQSPLDQVIDWLISWLMDMVRLANVANCGRLYNPGLRQSLQQEVQRLDLMQLFVYLDSVWEAKRLLSTQINRQLMLESLLIDWCLLQRTSH